MLITRRSAAAIATTVTATLSSVRAIAIIEGFMSAREYQGLRHKVVLSFLLFFFA